MVTRPPICLSVVLVLSAVHAPWAVAQGIPGLREVRLGPEPGRILAPPAFHERGWHIACVVSVAGGQRVYHDGVLVGAVYDQIAGLKLSPDGSRVAYAAEVGQKWRLVVDGQPGPEYDGIGEPGPIFSPDSGRVAYAARVGQKWRVAVDGQPGPGYDGIVANGPAFRPDGTLEWLAVRDGDLWRVTVAPLPE